MTAFVLKTIAMVTMLIDHVTYCFVPADTIWHWVGRGIGRISFPLFCYLIVEGYYYTKSLKKYIARLGILALLSEIPYDLVFSRSYYDPERQNAVFTLLMGLVTIALIDVIKKKFYPFNLTMYTVLTSVVLITFGMGAQLLGTDYGMYGVLVIVFMFYLRGRKPLLCICYFAGTLACFRLVSLFEIVSVIAFIIIFGYNGEKGPDDKKLYYLFYPCHLIILALITGAVYGWQVFT